MSLIVILFQTIHYTSHHFIMKQLNDLTFNTTLKAQNNNYNIAQWKPNNLTSIQNNIFHKKDNLFYYFFFFFLIQTLDDNMY
jgi:hypothetical protein